MSYRIRNAAAALLLSAAAATTAALVITDGGQAQQPTGQTLVLKNSAMKLADVDVPPLVRSKRSPETPGDEVIATSKVTGAASGSRYLFCAAAKRGKSIEKALYSCQVTYTLANGTITAAGVGAHRRERADHRRRDRRDRRLRGRPRDARRRSTGTDTLTLL